MQKLPNLDNSLLVSCKFNSIAICRDTTNTPRWLGPQFTCTLWLRLNPYFGALCGKIDTLPHPKDYNKYSHSKYYLDGIQTLCPVKECEVLDRSLCHVMWLCVCEYRIVDPCSERLTPHKGGNGVCGALCIVCVGVLVDILYNQTWEQCGHEWAPLIRFKLNVSLDILRTLKYEVFSTRQWTVIAECGCLPGLNPWCSALRSPLHCSHQPASTFGKQLWA